MMSNFDKLRRDALLFDQIAVSELTVKTAAWASQNCGGIERQKLADVQWLTERGILFDPHTTLDDQHLMDLPVHRDYLNARASLQAHLEGLSDNLLAASTPTHKTAVIDAGVQRKPLIQPPMHGKVNVAHILSQGLSTLLRRLRP
jgi:hypothetical protein